MNSQYWVGKDLATWHEAEVSDSFAYMYPFCVFKQKQNTLVFA